MSLRQPKDPCCNRKYMIESRVKQSPSCSFRFSFNAKPFAGQASCWALALFGGAEEAIDEESNRDWQQGVGQQKGLAACYEKRFL